MCIKNLVAASVICLTANVANAFDIEPFFGFGLTGDSILGIAEYAYTDGTDEKLVAGDGFGLLIGSEVLRLGDFAVDIRGGVQLTTMDAYTYDDDGNEVDVNSNFYFFPIFANVSYDITRRISVAGGASILLAPTYQITADDESIYFRADPSYGFNAELRYWAIPARLDKNVEAFYVLRFMYNDIDFTEFEDDDGDTYEVVDGEDELRAVQFGLKIRF